jgi:uncharacterized heparinase superfamily protein
MDSSLWFYTLKDVPIPKLLDRIWFESRRRVYKRLPDLMKKVWIGAQFPPPLNREDYLVGLSHGNPTNIGTHRIAHRNIPPTALPFNFVGESKILPYPIPWNSPTYSRLWQFNLHYFDWIRDDLNHLYTTHNWSESAIERLYLLQDWITHNPLGTFDGWHPYPTSLRLINWTWLLKAVPELQSPLFNQSLWLQLCYLYHYQETFFKGNHWFENLAALIIAGLNFRGKRAKKIVATSLNHLKKQLAVQILGDGGHFERSPMYHLILLKRLCEVIICLSSAGSEIPQTLITTLTSMTKFAQGIRLRNGNYPLWNDCAYNIAEPLDEIVACADRILGPSSAAVSPFNQRLLSCRSANLALTTINSPSPRATGILAFPDSGYFLLRTASGFEITFDAAPPCPPDLPAHAHSDCLSFDVYWRGEPLIVETGTSKYGSDSTRQWERGTLAHNTITLTPIEGGYPFDQTQVWGSFRAARKAQPKLITSGISGNQSLWHWVSASHSGYDWLKANHHRWLGCSEIDSGVSNNQFILIVLDWIQSKSPLGWIHRLHLGPGVICRENQHGWNLEVDNRGSEKNDRENPLRLQLLTYSSHAGTSVDNNSWYSPCFGSRHSRLVLTSRGLLEKSNWSEMICTVLTNSDAQFMLNGTVGEGWLSIDGVVVMRWEFENGVPIVEIK